MNSTKKMIVFDLDGTLLNSKNEVNKSSVKVLKKISKLGHYVCIATGRTLNESVKNIIKLLKLKTFIINVNGNFIYNIKTKETKCVGKFLLKSVVDAFKEKAIEYKRQLIAYNSNGEVKRYYYGTNQLDDIKDPEYFTNGIQVLEFDDLSGVDFFLNNPNKKIVHIGIKSERETSKKIFQELQGYEQVNLAHITLVSKVFVDADAIGVNKWNAILEVAKELNILQENIYAFGDSDNDLEMLLNSKHGYCMGNADESVKQHFKKENIIGSNDSDAISELLKKEFNLK